MSITSELSHDLPQDIEQPSTPTISIFDIPNEQFAKELNHRVQNWNLLCDWATQNLIKGVDFDEIGFGGRRSTKPTLLKGGAEKICAVGGLVAMFPNLDEYEKLAMGGGDLNSIVIRCTLLKDGHVVGEGAGGRTLKQDRNDLNKYLKMCLKSAFIDATLRTFGLNGRYTQDLEDMSKETSFKKPINKPKINKPQKPMDTTQKQLIDDYLLIMPKDIQESTKKWLKTDPSYEKTGEFLMKLRIKSKEEKWKENKKTPEIILTDDSMKFDALINIMVQTGMKHFGLTKTKTKNILIKLWREKDKALSDLTEEEITKTTRAIESGKIKPF